MSIQDSQILTVRLYDLQRTVERLSHHVSDLQSKLAQTQESNRPPQTLAIIPVATVRRTTRSSHYDAAGPRK